MVRAFTLLPLVAFIGPALSLSTPRIVLAQSQPLAHSRRMMDDMEQLAVDVHAGVDRSTLTPQQKAQLRDNFRELREARQNHEMFAEFRAARRIRTTLDSGAFKPEDQQRIKQDLQAIREQRETAPRPGM